MKQWLILGLAAIGAYAVYQWYQKSQATAQGHQVTPAGVLANTANATDIATGSLVSGVPGFDTTPVANGHGDQIMAAYHTNAHSTIDGGPDYQPAFGPDENRGGLSTW
jgi:hypothetical protein